MKFIFTTAYDSMPMGCILPFPGAEGDVTTDLTIMLDRYGDFDLTANLDKIQYAVVSNTTGNWTLVSGREDNTNSYDMTQRK